MVLPDGYIPDRMIGLFDETDVIDALLLACLKNGENPTSFNAGTVPLYIGPMGINRTATLVNCESGYGYRDDGTILFDGVNDALCLSAHALGGLAQVSFSCWCIISKDSCCIYGEWATATIWRFSAVINAAGNLLFITRNTTVTNVTASPAPIAKDILHYVVCVFDSVGLTQKVYVDGDLVATTAILNTPINIANISGVLPCYGFSDTLPFSSSISNGVFYKKALTEPEIATLYTLGPDLGGLKMYADGSLVAPSKRRNSSLHLGISLSL